MTTERIDPLAWLDADAVRAQQWRAENREYQVAREALANSIAARAAVEELVEAADICAEAFADYIDAEVGDGEGRNYPSYLRLRAALAAFGRQG